VTEIHKKLLCVGMVPYTAKKLAGPNQQNQIGPIAIFSIYFVLNCTINDNYRVSFRKKIMALLA